MAGVACGRFSTRSLGQRERTHETSVGHAETTAAALGEDVPKVGPSEVRCNDHNWLVT